VIVVTAHDHRRRRRLHPDRRRTALIPLAIDTGVAVALLVQRHRSHRNVVAWWDGRELALTAHSLAETHSLLTQLPETSESSRSLRGGCYATASSIR
jgi:hypothetical protein